MSDIPMNVWYVHKEGIKWHQNEMVRLQGMAEWWWDIVETIVVTAWEWCSLFAESKTELNRMAWLQWNVFGDYVEKYESISKFYIFLE